MQCVGRGLAPSTTLIEVAQPVVECSPSPCSGKQTGMTASHTKTGMLRLRLP